MVSYPGLTATAVLAFDIWRHRRGRISTRLPYSIAVGWFHLVLNEIFNLKYLIWARNSAGPNSHDIKWSPKRVSSKMNEISLSVPPESETGLAWVWQRDRQAGRSVSSAPFWVTYKLVIRLSEFNGILITGWVLASRPALSWLVIEILSTRIFLRFGCRRHVVD